MDQFQRQYSTYYFLLCITGLWPFDNSVLVKVQRIIFASIILCCVIVQMRFIYGSISNDCSKLKNLDEQNILMNHIAASKRLVLIYLRVSCFGIVCVCIVLLFPVWIQILISHNVTRSEGMKFLGFIAQHDKYVHFISLHILFNSIIGLLVISVTESTLSVMAYYVCGLFKITSYRIRHAVNKAIKQIAFPNRNALNEANIRDVVETHMKSIEIIEAVAKQTMLAYLIAILVVIISFSLNLYRVFLAVIDMTDLIEVLLSSVMVIIHMVIMFLNNYSGQKVIDDSMDVFYETYFTTWYYTPLKMQKLLLLMMVRSSIVCEFNLSGLFVPSYEGFSTMMSLSFSYFTVLYSVQTTG
ncbi:uncharacterized protein LOC128892641 isoform X2 [Hylaeus anthracinus]|uniref:uncharacterized protein LOC128892641 isoform X2 n=1 Tax=Hylaeus anthracinus TaxID=313031 RepID=UPI0023B92BFE|nr:uncharacterized protein LOC128892641 isoform X2 [Hylaeus anthracinus]